MKIKKNKKIIDLTEGQVKKIIANNKSTIMIKKDNKIINLTEEEVKKIINRDKINKFLSEDRISRVKHNKSARIELIVDKLRELNNILKTTEYGSEINKILNDIDEAVERQIEKIEDKLNGKDKKEK